MNTNYLTLGSTFIFSSSPQIVILTFKTTLRGRQEYLFSLYRRGLWSLGQWGSLPKLTFVLSVRSGQSPYFRFPDQNHSTWSSACPFVCQAPLRTQSSHPSTPTSPGRKERWFHKTIRDQTECSLCRSCRSWEGKWESKSGHPWRCGAHVLKKCCPMVIQHEPHMSFDIF